MFVYFDLLFFMSLSPSLCVCDVLNGESGAISSVMVYVGRVATNGYFNGLIAPWITQLWTWNLTLMVIVVSICMLVLYCEDLGFFLGDGVAGSLLHHCLVAFFLFLFVWLFDCWFVCLFVCGFDGQYDEYVYHLYSWFKSWGSPTLAFLLILTIKTTLVCLFVFSALYLYMYIDLLIFIVLSFFCLSQLLLISQDCDDWCCSVPVGETERFSWSYRSFFLFILCCFPHLFLSFSPSCCVSFEFWVLMMNVP